ncbi:MFS transporter [Halobacillus litoralis]|uniref:MFS transporter n=1 Tax=Halobacillus litoralis TaxID=45668 RepID=UPI001CD29633|nr:MFS transporter [Halobacillus litoralis]MCA0972428.1 MFS transporter [Halobacillus litoralis]
MLELLKNPAYLKLWCAQIISELGDGITFIVVMFLVSEQSSHPAVFSFILMAGYLPHLLLGVWAGPVIDRFSKKWIMVSSDLYRLLILLLMIPFHDSVVMLVTLTFLQGIGTVFFEPARTAAIPTIIEEEQIPKAVGLSQSTFTTMRVLAPSIGGALLLLDQVSWVFAIDSATFLVSGILLMTIKMSGTVHKEGEEKDSYLESLKGGLLEVKHNMFLKGILTLMVVTAFVMSIVGATIFDVILNVFEVQELHFGMLESTEGVFGIIGALLIPYFMKKMKSNQLLLIVIGATGVITIAIAPVYHVHQVIPFAPLYIWMAFVGLSSTCLNVPLNSFIMQVIPNDVLGRVSGLMNTLLNAGFLVGLTCGGGLASLVGGIPTVIAGGSLLILVSLIFPFTSYYQALHIEKDRQAFASA